MDNVLATLRYNYFSAELLNKLLANVTERAETVTLSYRTGKSQAYEVEFEFNDAEPNGLAILSVNGIDADCICPELLAELSEQYINDQNPYY
jgi:hypothetical protein